MWTNVARDRYGLDREWCGHEHATAQEAHDCSWTPSEELDYKSLSSPGGIYVLRVEPWNDPRQNAACVHELHPRECARCVELRALLAPCLHVRDPVTCERCALLNFWDVEVTLEEEQCEERCEERSEEQGGDAEGDRRGTGERVQE